MRQREKKEMATNGIESGLVVAGDKEKARRDACSAKISRFSFYFFFLSPFFDIILECNFYRNLSRYREYARERLSFENINRTVWIARIAFSLSLW